MQARSNLEEFRFSPRPNRAAEIGWQPWDAASFARAHALQKPVLLAISAVWCHWCHVMDETTYSDPAVIALVNERYIPVRVDADRRPEINERYNMGGWPTTAVLSPDGETITGATYLPPPAMLRFLEAVGDAFATRREELEAKFSALHARSTDVRVDRTALEAALVDNVVASISAGYDEAFGGFGSAPKFPQTGALELLLSELRFARMTGAGEGRLYEMLATTALNMSRAGMYDHVEGGFFRYSTTRDWTVPHFEKMAEDHAGLLRVYAGLYRISHNGAFRDTLSSATRFIRTVLRDPQTGLFAGSQDADEAYFALSLDERRLRRAPFVDRTSYVNWTSNLAAALLVCADVLGDDDLGANAITALDAVVDAAMIDDDGLVRHYVATDGSAHVRGLLDDQVWLLRALLDAHAYDGESRHRERAIGLADAVLRAFSAPDGGFVDNAYAASALGRVRIADRPIREGGYLADVLLRLTAITGDERYASAARIGLESLAAMYRRAGSFAAPFATAVRRALSTPAVVTVIGEPPDTGDFRADARMLPDPFTVVRTFAPDDARRATTGFPADAPRAYVCAGRTCSAPTATPAGIRDAFLALV